jgi:hypothetical protein
LSAASVARAVVCYTYPLRSHCVQVTLDISDTAISDGLYIELSYHHVAVNTDRSSLLRFHSISDEKVARSWIRCILDTKSHLYPYSTLLLKPCGGSCQPRPCVENPTWSAAGDGPAAWTRRARGDASLTKSPRGVFAALSRAQLTGTSPGWLLRPCAWQTQNLQALWLCRCTVTHRALAFSCAPLVLCELYLGATQTANSSMVLGAIAGLRVRVEPGAA